MLGASARHAKILGLCVLAGCASLRPTSTEPSRGRSEPNTSASAVPDACTGIDAPERLALEVGAWRTSATGLSIRYEGATHDSFEGGAFDLMLSLVLRVEGEPSQTWLPSALAEPRYVAFLGHCIRVAAGSPARVDVDVAPDRSRGRLR